MTELSILQEINENIKKLLAVIAVQGMSDDKKIITLQKMGFKSIEISSITGIPDGTVRKKWQAKQKK